MSEQTHVRVRLSGWARPRARVRVRACAACGACVRDFDYPLWDVLDLRIIKFFTPPYPFERSVGFLSWLINELHFPF